MQMRFLDNKRLCRIGQVTANIRSNVSNPTWNMVVIINICRTDKTKRLKSWMCFNSITNSAAVNAPLKPQQADKLINIAFNTFPFLEGGLRAIKNKARPFNTTAKVHNVNKTITKTIEIMAPAHQFFYRLVTFKFTAWAVSIIAKDAIRKQNYSSAKYYHFFNYFPIIKNVFHSYRNAFAMA